MSYYLTYTSQDCHQTPYGTYKYRGALNVGGFMDSDSLPHIIPCDGKITELVFVSDTGAAGIRTVCGGIEVNGTSVAEACIINTSGDGEMVIGRWNGSVSIYADDEIGLYRTCSEWSNDVVSRWIVKIDWDNDKYITFSSHATYGLTEGPYWNPENIWSPSWLPLDHELGTWTSPISGTIRNLYLNCWGPLGNDENSGDYWTLYINGSPTDMTVTIQGTTQTFGSDTSHTATVSAGDEIYLRRIYFGDHITKTVRVNLQIDNPRDYHGDPVVAAISARVTRPWYYGFPDWKNYRALYPDSYFYTEEETPLWYSFLPPSRVSAVFYRVSEPMTSGGEERCYLLDFSDPDDEGGIRYGAATIPGDGIAATCTAEFTFPPAIDYLGEPMDLPNIYAHCAGVEFRPVTYNPPSTQWTRWALSITEMDTTLPFRRNLSQNINLDDSGFNTLPYFSTGGFVPNHQPIGGGISRSSLYWPTSPGYAPLMGSRTWYADADEYKAQQYMPCGGTFKHFTFHLTQIPGSGGSWEFHFVVNGTPRCGTTMSGSTVDVELDNEVSVGEGDAVCMKFVKNSSPNLEFVTWFCEFVHTAAGNWMAMGSSHDVSDPDNDTTAYWYGSHDFLDPGAVRVYPFWGPAVIPKFVTRLYTPPGTGEYRAFYLSGILFGGGNSCITSHSGTSTIESDTGEITKYGLSTTDLLHLKSSSPADAGAIYWSILFNFRTTTGAENPGINMIYHGSRDNLYSEGYNTYRKTPGDSDEYALTQTLNNRKVVVHSAYDTGPWETVGSGIVFFKNGYGGGLPSYDAIISAGLDWAAELLVTDYPAITWRPYIEGYSLSFGGGTVINDETIPYGFVYRVKYPYASPPRSITETLSETVYIYTTQELFVDHLYLNDNIAVEGILDNLASEPIPSTGVSFMVQDEAGMWRNAPDILQAEWEEPSDQFSHTPKFKADIEDESGKKGSD